MLFRSGLSAPALIDCSAKDLANAAKGCDGLDVSAKAELHAALFEMARNGAAVLLSSSDVEELATACDRVLVVRSGGGRAGAGTVPATGQRIIAARDR